MTNERNDPNGSALNRVRQLFRFLKAFAEQGDPPPRTLGQQLWTLPLRDLPRHPSIVWGSVGTTQDPTDGEHSEDGENADRALLSVRRPDLTPPPRPPVNLTEFLKPGWERPDGAIEILPSRNVQRRGSTLTERFEDDPQRVAAFRRWRAEWSAWAEAERPAWEAMGVFELFYTLYGQMEREGERVELMMGDGRLRWTRDGEQIDHPLILQRVELIFDSKVPEFRIIDADRLPELYTAVLHPSASITPDRLNVLRHELETAAYHPFGGRTVSGYLKRVVQLLDAHGTFSETPCEDAPTRHPVVCRDPVLFLRRKSPGYPAAFDRIIEDLEQRSTIPTALLRLVGIDPGRGPDPVDEELSPWAEPSDLLLSKPANPEQIAVARALERHRAVIVQGPPGTGKSHTIANLIGHFVANGKRVLVTSHTTKALRVLRGQVVETIRPLCIAILENDLDGRRQLEQSVRHVLDRLTRSTESQLAREVEELTRRRSELNEEIHTLTLELRTAREAEYQPVQVAGLSFSPADAARFVTDHTGSHGWIPGRVEAGAPLPLAPGEIRDLYATNESLTWEEEAELEAGIPEPSDLADPGEFAAFVETLQGEPAASSEEFWVGALPGDVRALEAFKAKVVQFSRALERMEPWQLRIVAAGYAGGAEEKLWRELAQEVEEAAARWEAARLVLWEYEVEVPREAEPAEALAVVEKIIGRMERGGKTARLGLLVRPGWRRLMRQVRVNGGRPRTIAELRAVRVYLDLANGRRRLAHRWARQAEPAGLPAMGTMSPPPETVARGYAQQFGQLLGWWPANWPDLEAAARAAGFRWAEFRAAELARGHPSQPFERDRALIAGPLLREVSARLTNAVRAMAEQRLRELEAILLKYHGPTSVALRKAVRRCDVAGYRSAVERLRTVARKRGTWCQRKALLERLGGVAPMWAQAIRNRDGAHGGGQVPGDPELAWQWVQLRQEIDRRASLDERLLTAHLHERRAELQAITADLIDRKTWLEQLRRTDLAARQALQGWADIQRRIGRGMGRRVPELQAEARNLLAKARDAVPVWIMPLSRVAESFDPRRTRFDVVIVDEASQADVTGLLAWYLGDRIAVVGDHEQVSPLAVGQDIQTATDLIAQYLTEIPNRILFDGRLSIYDLARQCFGGVIALREHFRCVPDIIEFSNGLCYDWQIRPLRDPASTPRPHVVEFIVDERLGPLRENGTNLAEARAVVALLKAMMSMPEYEGKTFGAITLVGDEQAALIEQLALRLLGAVSLESRRFVAGNSAQFQGDERHVILLSMVDSPRGGVLPIRQTDAFKQRYNVAASRARDQLWLIHALDPNRDLQPGDLRRQLIEHVRDPGAKRREIEMAQRRAESPLERNVIERLVGAGYHVEPQVWVGHYRVDLVVSDGRARVAVECDGDRYHDVEQIPYDLARQAVLERAGWRFIRIRGTRFYRDRDGTMNWVFGELARLGVRPVGHASKNSSDDARAAEFRERVVRRAWEIMREEGWVGGENVAM